MVTILVVDGDENARRLYKRLFEPEGCRILAAGTSEEVAEMAADLKIDLAIVDFNVPGLRLMDHLALFWSRDIPVIVRTAQDNPPEDIPPWLPEAWLTKAGDLGQLSGAVAEALIRKEGREAAGLREEAPTVLSELNYLTFDDIAFL
jgi:CheY-like chemotaxis protein